jgi:5-methylcytosine-specific restriction endonuclease McrA
MTGDEETDEPAETATRQERKAGPCELCGRPGQALTFHHLIPRHCHRKKRFRGRFSLGEMRSRGLWVCRLCHGGIHDLIPDEKELGWRHSTRESLLAHEGVRRHVDWVRKQK